MGRMGMLIVLGLSMSAGIMGPTLAQRDTEAVSTFAEHLEEAKARSIAESAARVSLMEIFRDRDYKQGVLDKAFSGGGYDIVVDDSTLAPKVILKASGNFGSTRSDFQIVVNVGGSVPKSIRGAFTSNGPLTIDGNAVVDGRNHDADGNLVGGAGLPGVSTLGTVSQNGSAGIGGGAFGVELLPQIPALDDAIEELATWPDGGAYPTDPAQVLDPSGGANLSLDELKNIAKSGVNGSQYATSFFGLSLPLTGVTYIETDSWMWIPPLDYGENGGILVIHGPNGTGRVTNGAKNNFTGLVIADQYTRTQGGVIGGVITLNPTLTSGFTNNAQLLYSEEAISNALASVPGLDDLVSDFEVDKYVEVETYREVKVGGVVVKGGGGVVNPDDGSIGGGVVLK